MSKLSFTKKTALVAALGFNDGANNGFWRRQWRDEAGKWVEMGRGVNFQMRKKDGSITEGHGTFIGGTDKPGFGRVLVEGQSSNGLNDGVYEISSANGKEYSARISKSALAKQGITNKGKDQNTTENKLSTDIQNLDDVTIHPITEEDRKLSQQAPNPDQAKLIQQERDNSPIAQLPAGAESRLTPDELQQLMNGEGSTTETSNVNPEDFGWTKGDAGRNRPGQNFYHRTIGNYRLNAYQDKSGTGTIQMGSEGNTDYYPDWASAEGDMANFLDNTKKQGLADAKTGLKPYDSNGDLAKMIDDGASALEIQNALNQNEQYQKDQALLTDARGKDMFSSEERAADTRTTGAFVALRKVERFNNAPKQDIAEATPEDKLAVDLFKSGVNGDQLPTVDALESKLQDRGQEPEDKFQMEPMIVERTPALEADYGDYFQNPNDLGQVLRIKNFGASDFVDSKEVLNVIAEDANGDEHIIPMHEDSTFRKVTEWTAKKNNAAPKQEEAKSGIPDSAEQVALQDLKPGDKFYNTSGDLYGTVDSVEPHSKPGKSVVNYTDDKGDKKSFIAYNENTYATDKANKSEDATPISEPTPVEQPAPETTPTPTPEVTPAPEATPEVPAPSQEVPPTPEAPAATPEKNVKPKARANDAGKLIPRQKFTQEQLDTLRQTKLDGLVDDNGAAVLEYDTKGKPYQPKDPNAMLNFLAKAYPNAKFNEQGHLVLMRQVSNENGKKIQWEIRAANSGDKKVIYMFHFKDLNTGQEETLIHKDARDSVQALMGKTNSPEVLADILTGVETRKFGRYDSANANDVLERAHYFALQGRTKNTRDLVNHYANGFAARYNPTNGTQLEAEVKSLFDAFESKDNETTMQRMRAVFGRLPIDEQSHAEARTALRDMFKERYPGVDGREFGALVTAASNATKKQQFDTPENRAIPYSSADKVTSVEEGMVVEYTNNIGEKSVLKVTKLKRVDSAAPIQSKDVFDYGDYAILTDSLGNQTKLPTTNLRILKDQKTELTVLKRRVSGKALREARGFTYNPTQLRFPDQPSIPDRVMLVDDLTPGDSFYGKGGNNLGHIIEVVPILGKDDKTGYGIMYIDSNGDIHKVAVASGETRGPDIKVSDAKKAEAPTAPTEAPAEKTINSNTSESDPDFDLEAIQFTTDPNTVEKPKSAGLNFKLPSNAIRRAEEQLKLNEEIQSELDQMTAGLVTAMGPEWTYDKSSFQASSFYSSTAFDILVKAAKDANPDLSEEQIRILLELGDAKASGYFSMSKAQIIDRILQEAATYKKDTGVVQNLQFDVARNKDGSVELAVTPEEKAKYDQALADIENFASNVKMGPLFDPKLHNIRIVNGSGKFADMYKAAAFTRSTRGSIASQVLGVNLSMPVPGENKKTVSILINNSLLRSGAGPEGFVNPISDTVTHEFGHSVHRTLEDSSFYGGPYAKAFKKYITRYGTSKQEEHFAESFSKYIQTGESDPTFFEFLQSVGLA
jgi:hypothetical protein